MLRRISLHLLAGVAATLAIVATLAYLGPAAHAHTVAALALGAHVGGLSLAGAGLAIGSLTTLEPPLDYNGLVARRTAGVKGYRVFPDFLYDTVNFPAAGPAAGSRLNFFAGVNANANDPTLTNLASGSLPAPQMFWIQRITMKALIETTAVDDTASSSANITRDLDRIVTTSRSFLQWSTSASTIVQGTIPLNALGQLGGVVPTFGGNNVPAAAHGWIYNSPRLAAHGGFPMDIVLFPQEVLSVSLLFGVQQAITAQTALRIECYGWRYIPVGVG